MPDLKLKGSGSVSALGLLSLAVVRKRLKWLLMASAVEAKTYVVPARLWKVCSGRVMLSGADVSMKLCLASLH